MDDGLWADDRSRYAAHHHQGYRARPERSARRFGGGKAELLNEGGREPDQERAGAKQQETCLDQRQSREQRPEGADDHPGDETWPATNALHQEGGGNRSAGCPHDEGSDRQRCEGFVLAQQVVRGDRSHREIDRRRGASQRARDREHENVASRATIVDRHHRG